MCGVSDQRVLCVQDPLQDEIIGLVKKGGAEFRGIINTVNPLTQFVALVQRMLLNAHRDVGVFWLRFFLYLGLALCLATIYYGLDKTWADTVSRSGCIFFAISFLTFMAISGFPSFIDEMQVRDSQLRTTVTYMHKAGLYSTVS